MDPYIYKKGPAFGMPGVLVDGMDVMKVLPIGCPEALCRAHLMRLGLFAG